MPDLPINQLPNDSSPTYLDLLAIVNGNSTDRIELNRAVAIGTVSSPLSSINPYMPPPQGRLTLQSGIPVTTTSTSNASVIYYTPYVGNGLPIFDGANFVNHSFSQLTLTLNSGQHTSGAIYDVFAFINSGVITLGAGPDWASTTARTSSITASACGLWTNTGTINLTNNGTAYNGVLANQATYLGTFYCNAAASVSMTICFNNISTLGGPCVLGLYNAYNKVKTSSFMGDPNSAYTYTSNVARDADGSLNTRVWFVDGLGQSIIETSYRSNCQVVSSTGSVRVGTGFNNSFYEYSAILANNATLQVALIAEGPYPPKQGLNYIAAGENSDNTNANYFNIGGTSNGPNGLHVSLEM